MKAFLVLLSQLNTALPTLLAIYKTVRTEAKQLDADVPSFSDSDLIRLLLEESEETTAKAQAILDRLNAPPE